MKFTKWFLIGCVSIGIPFFALFQQYDMWPSVLAGSAGGILFFIVLFVRVVRKNFSLKEQIFLGSIHSILIIAFLAYSAVMYKTTHFQRENLNQIRSAVGSNIIIEDEIDRRAIPLLREYHGQSSRQQHVSIVETFKKQYGASIQDSVFIPNANIKDFQSPTWTFVRYSGDTLIQLISIDSVAKGREQGFIGHTGQRGKVQYTAVITEKGVNYERNN